MKIKNFYGFYSSGASFDTEQIDYFSKKNISLISKQIKKNLNKMKISEKNLKDKVIMNVGSGREALGFIKYKPKKIFHYDISNYNIKRFKKFVVKNKLNNQILSNQLDISKDRLPLNKFDFIYLHGIIQHTDYVNKSLKNLILSMKLNGKMWFYFYRPGSLNIFLGSVQRYLLKGITIKNFQKFLSRKLSRNFIDGMMDDCFVPNRQLFYPIAYKKNFNRNGVLVYGNSFLKNLSNKVDFFNYHQSVVFFVKKIVKKNYFKIIGLSRNKDVDVLDKKLYNTSKYNNILNILKLVKQIREKKVIEIVDIVIKLEKIKLFITNKFFKKKQLSKHEYYNIVKNLEKILI